MTILLTGFGSFDPTTNLFGNPSEKIARALAGRPEYAGKVVLELLPPRPGDSGQEGTAAAALRQAIGRHRPRGILSLGKDLQVTVNAYLEIGAYAPDLGWMKHLPGRLKDVAAGDGRFKRLSDFAAKIATEAERLGIKTANSIGAYACNDTYWTALKWAAETGAPAAFLHVPPFIPMLEGKRQDKVTAQIDGVLKLMLREAGLAG
jgi:pyrrolidone-carboxylate peptidase